LKKQNDCFTDLEIEERTIKGCSRFRYLGSVFNNTSHEDLCNNIRKVEAAIRLLHCSLMGLKHKCSCKKKPEVFLYKGICNTYEAEPWMMNKDIRRKLLPTEMGFWRCVKS
jgi:hypothetical protein